MPTVDPKAMTPWIRQRSQSLNQNAWFTVLTLYVASWSIFGFAASSFEGLPSGLARIFSAPGPLVTDYIAVGGLAAACLNATLVGLSGLLLVRATGVLLSGPTIAAIFTMTGFGFFGKNVWSIWPIIAGVALFSKVARRPFKGFILVALFGTALAPLVTQVAFGLQLGLPAGILAGIAVGFLLPAVAVYMLRLHQGFNLYNVGLTCGFIGLFVTSLLTSFGADLGTVFYWSTDYHEALCIFLLIYLSTMTGLGYWLAGRPAAMRTLIAKSGTLPTDFVELFGAGTTLINMGLVGLMGWLYVVMVGGDFSGPVVGGLLTMAGFGAFGKHPRNAAPTMLGVFLGAKLMVWSAHEPGPLLAALFATTLAPISGEFGPSVGLAAGIMHLALVMRTGPWHAGLNLYNNGFAGGLTATLIVAIADWWTAWREEHGSP